MDTEKLRQPEFGGLKGVATNMKQIYKYTLKQFLNCNSRDS